MLNKRATAILLGGLTLLPLAAQEQGEPIPAFLQGVDPQILNSKPMQRFIHNYNLRANPDGTLPDAQGARVTAAISSLPQQGPAFTIILNSRWTNIGPQPIVNGQVGNVLTTRAMSGRVASLSAHPTDPNRWLVGTANGGVWETRDGGNNFVALTDATPSLAIGAVAYAPSNPSIIYAGTGENTFSGDSFGGNGILKSVDGGLSWTQLATATFVVGTAFSDLKVDPNNPNIIVAATGQGIFGRSGATQFSPAVGARGLWRSIDGGSTWTQQSTLRGTSISIDSGNYQRQYAGTGDGNSVTTTVQRSIDGGITWATAPGPWTSLSGNVDHTEVAVAPSNADRVYVAVSNSATAGLFGLWTTANAWAATPTWTQISVAPTDDGTGTKGPCAFDKAFNAVSAQCWYNMELTVKPTDENLLFFGGIPVWRYNLGTNTWVEVSQTASPANRNNGIHVDQHASTWTANGRLVFGNDGGVWSTTSDGDNAWFDHNTTLATAQYYEGATSPDASLQTGGSQDNGTHVRSGAQGWPLTFGGDGAGTILSTNTSWGVSSQNQGVARTTNAGSAYTSVRGNYAGVAPFIGKIKECAPAPGTVILNGSRVNKTTVFFTGPAGTLWTANGGALFANAQAGTGIAFGNNCNTIATGNAAGQLILSTNGGVTAADFRTISNAPAVTPMRPIATVAFDPNNNTRVCAGFTGFTGGAPANIFCTDDFTVPAPTWINRSVPVDVSIDALLFDPTVADKIYAGSDFGVWLSTDGGATWAHWGPQVGMPNVPVYDLVARNGKLFAFTHGRGAFVLSNFDVNNDSVVNCADVNVIKAAFGKRIGDAGFNPAADLNSDNIINVRDLSMLTRQLPAGVSCP